MTVRLFYDDPALIVFEADILDRRRIAGRDALVLDRTAFYPTSGGQPHDTGRLAEARVLDVVEAEDGEVLHIVDRPPVANHVQGTVDADRRQDHREHHTGQHLLSRAFVEVLGASTIGFHLGPAGVDIDLDSASLDAAGAESVEQLANRIVRENRTVRIHYVSGEDERARFGLQGAPERDGALRVIEIEGFDATPCGGTHCLATGEIGLIKIRKWEKVGSRVRVHFLCGGRAVSDYARKNRLVVELARRLSVEEAGVGEAVDRLVAETGQLRKELRTVREEIAHSEAGALLAASRSAGGTRLVLARKDGSSADELSALASILRSSPKVVFVLGAVEAGTARIFMGRSEDVAVDLRTMLPGVLAPIAGRGGGRAESVQGAGPKSEGLDEALARARDELLRALAAHGPPS